MKSKFWIIACGVTALLVMTAGLTWRLRGDYDRLFMMKGTIHLVNTTDQTIDATLDFPSGKQHSFTITANGSETFVETDTGEGAIGISIPGRPNEYLGYITSMNKIIVLSIGDNETTFSQIFP